MAVGYLFDWEAGISSGQPAVVCGHVGTCGVLLVWRVSAGHVAMGPTFVSVLTKRYKYVFLPQCAFIITMSCTGTWHSSPILSLPGKPLFFIYVFFVIFSITYISLFFAPVSQNFVHLLAWFYHLLSARLDYDMAAIESLTQLSMIWLKIPFSQEMSASLANPQFPAEAPVTYDGADAGGARSNEMSGVTRAISPPFITQLSRAGDCWRCHQYFVVIFRILYTILAPSPCWKCLLVCSQSIT